MNKSHYAKFTQKLAAIRNKQENALFAASQLSLLECQVKPLRDRNEDLLRRYQYFFSASNLNLVPISLSIIEQATLLRAKYNLPTPDAIQAASALSLSDQVLFLTGDSDFKKIPQLEVVLI